MKVNWLFVLMVVLFSGPLSGCLIIHKEGVSRIEVLETSPPSFSPVETTLVVKQTVDVDENLILLSPKNTRRLQDKMTSFLDDTGQVKVVSNSETATHSLEVAFKEVTHHNELWAIVAISTLFIVPYHGSNDNKEELRTIEQKSMRSHPVREKQSLAFFLGSLLNRELQSIC